LQLPSARPCDRSSVGSGSADLRQIFCHVYSRAFARHWLPPPHSSTLPSDNWVSRWTLRTENMFPKDSCRLTRLSLPGKCARHAHPRYFFPALASCNSLLKCTDLRPAAGSATDCGIAEFMINGEAHNQRIACSPCQDEMKGPVSMRYLALTAACASAEIRNVRVLKSRRARHDEASWKIPT
jgi:hypothetical protein